MAKNKVLSIKRAVERLEEIPREIEDATKKKIRGGKIVSRLLAEEVLKKEFSEVFEAGEPSHIQDIIAEYFKQQYHARKENVHRLMMRRKGYLPNLFKSLEDPNIDDERRVFTDSFGNKLVGERSGLEYELYDVASKQPQFTAKIVDRAESWISSRYPLVQSSGYFILSHYITYILPRDEARTIIAKYEHRFLEGLNSQSERVRRQCLSGLGAFMGLRARENEAIRPYQEVVKIANDPEDSLRKVASEILGIILKIDV